MEAKNNNIKRQNKNPKNANKKKGKSRKISRRPPRIGNNKSSILKTDVKITKELFNNPNSVERSILEPSSVNWVDLPCFPHPYGVFTDCYTKSLTCNGSGALGMIFLPQFLPSCSAQANATNAAYWNGTSYTGNTSVTTVTTTNPMTAMPISGSLFSNDKANFLNYTEMTCLGFKVTVSTPVPFTTSQGSIYGGIRPMTYDSITYTTFSAGVTYNSATIFDTINYAGPILALSPKHKASCTLVGTNSLSVTYYPHETTFLSDFSPYNGGIASVPSDALPGRTDNVISFAIFGAASSQTVLIKVESVFGYLANTQSVIAQTMKNSQDPRLIQSVIFDLNRSDFSFANTNTPQMSMATNKL
jgi:hypothetical protein